MKLKKIYQMKNFAKVNPIKKTTNKKTQDNSS